MATEIPMPERPVVEVDNPTFEDSALHCDLENLYFRLYSDCNALLIRQGAACKFLDKTEMRELHAVLGAWLETGLLPVVKKKATWQRRFFQANNPLHPHPRWEVCEHWHRHYGECKVVNLTYATREEVENRFNSPEEPK